MQEVSDKLLKEVKIHCGITWNNNNTDQQIIGIIKDGFEEFISLFGNRDVESPGRIHRLFLAYCKYSYYDQSEDFNENYKKEILSERMAYEVKYHEAKKIETIS